MNLFADMPSPDDDDAPALVAEVLLPVALDKAYSYLVPAGMALGEGDVVLVPLAKRQTAGVVWALRGVDGAGSNLRSVIGRIDVPSFRKSLRDFLDWIAWYTLAPRGLAMKLALRVPEGAGPDESRMLEPPRIRPLPWA